MYILEFILYLLFVTSAIIVLTYIRNKVYEYIFSSFVYRYYANAKNTLGKYLKKKGYTVNILEKSPEENVKKQIIETVDIDMKTKEDNVVPDSSNNIRSTTNTRTNEDKTNSEKILQLEQQLRKKNRIIKELKTKHKKSKKELQLRLLRLKNEVCKTNSLTKIISTIFNDDQVNFLKQESKKVAKWCNNTLLKSYRLKFACGSSGYSELLKQKYPLPSLRTLTRKLENLKFRSGLIDEIFDFLRIKVLQFKNETDKDCMLVLDEMSITAGNIYDNSTKEMLGQVTLPDHNGEANQALVFLIAGLASRWKQIVAYYFTNKKTCGKTYKPIIIEIINKCEEIGLRVHSVTSDMGSSNQSMWNSFNISANKYSTLRNSCKHPYDEKRNLWFFGDIPHAFKNIKNGFLTNEIFIIPDILVKKYSLPNNIVKASHLKELLSAQQNFEFRLAPKLRSEYLDTKKHFLKMRVSSATNVFSNETSSALKFLAEEHSKEEYYTTAWFVDFIYRWFKIMTARHLALGLGKKNIESYEDTIAHLKNSIELFSLINVGNKNQWKPFQTSVMISTTSFLEISEYLLNKRDFKFILGSRFTQDCLENVFSIVRSKNEVPNCLQFKNNIKLISISQYMKNVSAGNYENDDRTFLSEFLDILQNRTNNTDERNDNINKYEALNLNIPDVNIELDNIELNVLYYISGYIVGNISKNQTTCYNCLKHAGSKTPKIYNYSKLIRLKKKSTKETLYFVNNTTFNFFLSMETIFRAYYKTICSLREKLNMKQFFVSKFEEISYYIPDCHNLKKKIVNRYSIFRLRIASQKSSKQAIVRNSKTMAMHSNVQ